MKSLVPKILNIQTHLRLHTQRHISTIDRLQETKKSHAQILKNGVSATETDLISSYCESKAFLNALQLFDETPDWSLVSATIAIGHFARHGGYKDALSVFTRMLSMDIRPSEYTFGSVIQSSIALRDLNNGKQLHACAIKTGLHSNVFAGSALLDLYAKLGGIEEARRAFEDTFEPNVVSYTTLICGYLRNERFNDAEHLFSAMPDRNIVSWNAMIGGYSQTGRTEEAVNLFVKMCREGLRPNQSTFPCVFSAAANITALGMGKAFHGCAVKVLGRHLDVYVGNSLVSFYSKCGSMDDSLLAFTRLPERNVVSWNAMICGYAQNGRGETALEFYERMRSSGLRPNKVTLLCLLLACNHAGLVDAGLSYFSLLRNENPSMVMPEHYACVVDMLSRSGCFSEAVEFLQDLPFNPGIGFWKGLLGGCLRHSNMELAEVAAQHIQAFDPGDVSSYVMLSNASSAAGDWQSVSLIRREMRDKKMKRIPGCSWIEIMGKVHTFVTGDKNHVDIDDIYVALKHCVEHMKELPSTNIVEEY
ncbi:hypothetical protein Sjap_001711 [Stephania japonica]|uniref:Pentatricopeptide repeat-containing protein n=1 Tax=Stephania japonica TaxID=461633 RepID=A0AAP0KKM2_9MAGN